MKRKFLLPILSVCMVAALVSVGFAAWLITGNDTEGASGQFVTYGVDNDYFSVKATDDNEATKITFGKNGTPTSPWLTVDGVADQVLSKTFTITITPDVAFSSEHTVTKILNGDSVQVTLNGLAAGQTAETEGTTAKKYAAAVENGVIDYPTLSCGSENTNKATNMTTGAVIKLAADDFTVAEGDKKTATATVTVTFAWGNNGNPYTYYNGLTNTPENRLAATTALGLVNALNNQSYYLHLAVVQP